MVVTRTNAAAALAALVEGSLAQIPGAGSVIVPTIQAALVFHIGQIYSCHLTRSQCLTIATFFASNHVKRAMLQQIVGFIPGVGNVVKGSLTFGMTKGMGTIAGKSLRCGSVEPLLEEASAGGFDRRGEEPSGQLFHLVSDYLAAGTASASETLGRVMSLFESKTEERLLEEVRNAVEPDELVKIVAGYSWHLDVVAAALDALTAKFSPGEACSATGIVLEKLWKMGEEGAREVAAGYLSRCVSRLAPAVLRDVAGVCTSIITAAARGSDPLLEATIALLARVMDHGEQISLAVHEHRQHILELQAEASGEPVGGHVPAFQGAAEQMLPEGLDHAKLFSGLTAAHGRGIPGACELLLLLARSTRHQGLGMSISEEIRAWASVAQLRKLRSATMPRGAGVCVEALQAKMRAALTLDAVPPVAEFPVGGRGAAAEPDYTDFVGHLSGTLVGQTCPLQKLGGYVRLKHRGRWRHDTPLVLLLCGPPGIGKTLIARLIAEVLHGRPVAQLEGDGRFRVFHMNQYTLLEDQANFFGAPRGTVNSAGDLPELLKRHPDAVVVLDEVEKAHHSFAQALLKVLGEHGAVADVITGRDVSTSRATFILTSNTAEDLILRHFQEHQGLKADRTSDDAERDECEGYGELQQLVLKELSKPKLPSGALNFFKDLPLRSRLTEVVPFLPFRAAEVEQAVRLFLEEEAKACQELPGFGALSLAWEPDVVRHFAAVYHLSPAEGLRGVRNSVHRDVSSAVEDALDVGLLQPGGGALLRILPGARPGVEVRAVARPVETGGGLGGGWGAAGGEGVAFGSDWGVAGGRGSASAASWWAPAFGGLASLAGFASTNAASGHASSAGEMAMHFEYETQWSWESAYEWVMNFLFEWRYEIAFVVFVLVSSVGVATFSGATTAAGVAGGTTGAAGMASAASAGSSAGAASSAAVAQGFGGSCLSGLLGLSHLAVGVLGVVGPPVVAYCIWHKYGNGTVGVGILLLSCWVLRKVGWPLRGLLPRDRRPSCVPNGQRRRRADSVRQARVPRQHRRPLPQGSPGTDGDLSGT